jgi:hypothetical protein
VTRSALTLAVVLAAGCSGGNHANNALHHHYFLVGKRTCADALHHGGLRPLHLKGITVVWSSPTIVTANVNTSRIPKPYRHDEVAGCNAAG